MKAFSIVLLAFAASGACKPKPKSSPASSAPAKASPTRPVAQVVSAARDPKSAPDSALKLNGDKVLKIIKAEMKYVSDPFTYMSTLAAVSAKNLNASAALSLSPNYNVLVCSPATACNVQSSDPLYVATVTHEGKTYGIWGVINGTGTNLGAASGFESWVAAGCHNHAAGDKSTPIVFTACPASPYQAALTSAPNLSTLDSGALIGSLTHRIFSSLAWGDPNDTGHSQDDLLADDTLTQGAPLQLTDGTQQNVSDIAISEDLMQGLTGSIRITRTMDTSGAKVVAGNLTYTPDNAAQALGWSGIDITFTVPAESVGTQDTFSFTGQFPLAHFNTDANGPSLANRTQATVQGTAKLVGDPAAPTSYTLTAQIGPQASALKLNDVSFPLTLSENLDPFPVEEGNGYCLTSKISIPNGQEDLRLCNMPRTANALMPGTFVCGSDPTSATGGTGGDLLAVLNSICNAAVNVSN